MSCKYQKDKICLCSGEDCLIENNDSCEIIKKISKNRLVVGEDLYIVRNDVICRNCGCHSAYQSKGRYYKRMPESLIDKNPELYGKYYNKEHLFNSVGFGGTIPYVCPNCGNIGLINCSLEGYDNAFEDDSYPPVLDDPNECGPC